MGGGRRITAAAARRLGVLGRLGCACRQGNIAFGSGPTCRDGVVTNSWGARGGTGDWFLGSHVFDPTWPSSLSSCFTRAVMHI